MFSLDYHSPALDQWRGECGDKQIRRAIAAVKAAIRRLNEIQCLSTECGIWNAVYIVLQEEFDARQIDSQPLLTSAVEWFSGRVAEALERAREMRA